MLGAFDGIAELLLADEPTGNLDPVNATNALTLLQELCSEVGAALLLVSHDEKVVGNFDLQVEWSELNQAFKQAMNR